jgi:hypothetical protein
MTHDIAELLTQVRDALVPIAAASCSCRADDYLKGCWICVARAALARFPADLPAAVGFMTKLTCEIVSGTEHASDEAYDALAKLEETDDK